MILYYKCGSGELDVQVMFNWLLIVDFLPLAFDRWFGWLSNLRMIFPCQMWNLIFSCLPIYTFFLCHSTAWRCSFADFLFHELSLIYVWKNNLCHLLKYMIQNLCVIWPFWKIYSCFIHGLFSRKSIITRKTHSRN